MLDTSNFDSSQLAWQKMNGLMPAIIQHAQTGAVLMLGYMNEDALNATLANGQVYFYSRSQQRLWRKGETSGNTLTLMAISSDCDNDTLLLQVLPQGATCHLGTTSCFPTISEGLQTLAWLSTRIAERAKDGGNASYTQQLIQQGKSRCAQKVGEEAVETIIAALNNDKQELINECADLLYHLLVLLHVCAMDIYHILHCLKNRE